MVSAEMSRSDILVAPLALWVMTPPEATVTAPVTTSWFRVVESQVPPELTVRLPSPVVRVPTVKVEPLFKVTATAVLQRTVPLLVMLRLVCVTVLPRTKVPPEFTVSVAFTEPVTEERPPVEVAEIRAKPEGMTYLAPFWMKMLSNSWLLVIARA